MPDEDLNIGTSPTIETAPTEASSSIETTETQTENTTPESNENTAVTPTAPLKNSVGEALEAFQRSKNETPYTQQQNTQVRNEPTPRDYSGLQPDEINIFKRMNNEAFNTLKPIYLNHQKLQEENAKLKAEYENASKSSFYEHERAYQVTPEYEQFSSNLNQIDAEIYHWQKQLESIRGGTQWHDLVRDNQGNVVLGPAQDPTPAAESRIVNAMIQGQQIKGDLSNKISQIKTEFSTNHKSFTAKMNEITDNVFKGADKKVLEQAMAKKLPIFPTHMHNDPRIRTLATALAVIDGLTVLLQQKDSQAASNTLKSRTAANSGLKGDDLQSGASKTGKVSDVWNEFKQARQQGVL